LLDLDLDLEVEQLVCFSGPAGSGAKALAVDVLLAESQRRYCAVLSPLERQRIRAAAPAAVDEIVGLPPAVLLSQRLGPARLRGRANMIDGMNVGDFLQVTRFFADLFLRLGTITCPTCGQVCESYDVESAACWVTQQSPGTALVVAPLELEQAPSLSSVLEILQQSGFTRLFLGNRVVRFEDLSPVDLEAAGQGEELLVVIDRIRSVEEGGQRLREALRTARAIGRGRSLVANQEEDSSIWLNQSLTCAGCSSTYDDPTVDELLAIPYRGAIHPEHVGLDGCSLHCLLAMQIDEAFDFSTTVMESSSSRKGQIESHRALLGTTAGLSLGHLHLDRSLSQLSTGEHLRLVISAAASAGLVGILYVCQTPVSLLDDEARAQTLLLLRQLVDRGNTVIVVDDDPLVHSRSDRVLWFSQGKLVPPPPAENPGADDWPDRELGAHPTVRDLPDITITGKGIPPLHSPIEVTLSPGQLTCVTGISGSGKSSLLRELILPAFRSSQVKKGITRVGVRASVTTIRRARLIGDDARRSEETVLETLGVLGGVTGLFARTPVAQQRGYASEWFQLDSPGGRCPGCEGRGRVLEDMEFLDDLDLPCPTCEGRRFQPEVMQITWRGRSMADVLRMNAVEAADYFQKQDALAGPLTMASSLGLEACLLGDRTTDLERSMALRVQLCAIQHRVSEKDLILLDTPASGGNAVDVTLLLALLAQICDRGATVVVAESRSEIVAAADRVITMGPGRGVEGGRVIA